VPDGPLEYADAVARVVASAPGPEAERVPVAAALGRVLAAPLASLVDHPSADDSAMDGYAVRAGDAVPGAWLEVAGEAAAGRPWPGELGPGQALRIFTGAPLPAGADAILRQEEAEASGGRVRATGKARREDIRRQGEDLRNGERYLPAGRSLGPAEVALAVAMGHTHVEVARRPRVAILTTGDEVVAAGNALAPGQVYDSNRYALVAQVQTAGAQIVFDRHLPDDPAETADALREAAAVADLILTSGGVSVGDHDHVRKVAGEVGEILFWRVRMRPGAQVLLARLGASVLLGLPGNPVTTMVAFELFAARWLRAATGTVPVDPVELVAVALDGFAGAGDRSAFRRCRLEQLPDGRLGARTTGPQGSGILRSMVDGSALAIVPAGAGDLAPGRELRVIPWRWPR
jgi:molybdopterin molybdotransferase